MQSALKYLFKNSIFKTLWKACKNKARWAFEGRGFQSWDTIMEKARFLATINWASANGGTQKKTLVVLGPHRSCFRRFWEGHYLPLMGLFARISSLCPYVMTICLAEEDKSCLQLCIALFTFPVQPCYDLKELVQKSQMIPGSRAI